MTIYLAWDNEIETRRDATTYEADSGYEVARRFTEEELSELPGENTIQVCVVEAAEADRQHPIVFIGERVLAYKVRQA